MLNDLLAWVQNDKEIYTHACTFVVKQFWLTSQPVADCGHVSGFVNL